jgi:F-type H+-transporting ATPase subunit a
MIHTVYLALELVKNTGKTFNSFISLFVQKTLLFIAGIVKENLHINKYVFFSIYYFSFISILTFNVLGLLPYSVTATSSFIMILNYSFSILVGLNIIGFYLHSTKYFNQFLPEGVPLFIAPVLVIIELFSNVIRIFSLTVRLFANILAGHSLLKILIGVS